MPTFDKPHRIYRHPLGTIVEWRPELCTHCTECITGLPAVFNLSLRPWVDLSKAAPSEIIAQVEKCPSKALAIGAVQ
jgi:uncharacterized Fe-S cluster protein YjdI